MTREEFELQVETTLARAKDIRLRKGKDYKGREMDVLGGFKNVSFMIELPPKVVLGIFLAKQLGAIFQYLKTGVLTGEPLQDRIVDSINYLLFLQAMVEEEENDFTPPFEGHYLKEAAYNVVRHE
jgi:hypothetical protein